ncbi:hypothetical protein K501DRAFT_335519 [Backusella circina FSU 941]|nr:hypothetical protein K501DRAFT_335519 [Backusella circina FSU 941]
MAQRKKKTEYHFVDMNDPDRYKKLKVARACEFCRKRKSKCDIGIPGSGTCSNCKKANNICIFSPSSIKSNENNHVYDIFSTFLRSYQNEFPLFSIDSKGHCEYEKDISTVYVHVTLPSSSTTSLPCYTEELKHELFDCYFEYVHPFYPLLDKYSVLQAVHNNKTALSQSFKAAIMALALHFSSHHDKSIATAYYQYALNHLNHYDEPSLSNMQTFLLLYKYQEVITPVGTPLSSVALSHLKEALQILEQMHQNPRNNWTIQDEFLCRAHWILYMNLVFSNLADPRTRALADSCATPLHLPALTEIEQYNKEELGTTCNFVYLANITTLFSQTATLISDYDCSTSSSPFRQRQFIDLATGLDNWRKSLPDSILYSLSADQTKLYSNHQEERQCNEPPSSSAFISYLCLIYSILHLMISHYSSLPTPHDLSDPALEICYRANCMMRDPLSRMASVHGNRLVSFAVTLGMQLYQFAKFSTRKYANGHFEAACSLVVYRIYDQLSLSSQLYLAIQSFKNKFELKTSEVNHHPIYQQQQFSNSCPSLYVSMMPETSQLAPPQPQPQQQLHHSQSQEWYHYDWSATQQQQLSWNTPDLGFHSVTSATSSPALMNHSSDCLVQSFADETFQMPLTPTTDISPPPLVMSSTDTASSYFEIQQQDTSLLSIQPFDSMPYFGHYDPKCCQYNVLY